MTKVTIAPPISLGDLDVRLARDGFDATFPGLARPCAECNGSGRASSIHRPIVSGASSYRDRSCIKCKGTGEAPEA